MGEKTRGCRSDRANEDRSSALKGSMHRLMAGREKSIVLCIDDFEPDAAAIALAAADRARFDAPQSGTYPGVRAALPQAYCDMVIAAFAPVMREAFDLGGVAFSLLDAALSLVTTPPEELTPYQCVPHIDTPDPARFALLHFLCDERFGGTAFFRQTATGFETVTPRRSATYALARDRAIQRTCPVGYVDANDRAYERTLAIPARFGRLLIYPSNLLHSGAIARPDLLTAEPRRGRLTANLFVEARAPHARGR